jgi:hypothetical protein
MLMPMPVTSPLPRALTEAASITNLIIESEFFKTKDSTPETQALNLEPKSQTPILSPR